MPINFCYPVDTPLLQMCSSPRGVPLHPEIPASGRAQAGAAAGPQQPPSAPEQDFSLSESLQPNWGWRLRAANARYSQQQLSSKGKRQLDL